ncbi:hypothetical protein ANCCAN_19231 [Ancylostoma caninum]|uniref:Uncharacterized protein n=1 Tax=Ancylostoma caninum TaxID=29170 RepID=A0A368FRT8_ANCCA|nr:hypothetical protein ANCCAN_19231 [Ancylostoma caninum]
MLYLISYLLTHVMISNLLLQQYTQLCHQLSHLHSLGRIHI